MESQLCGVCGHNHNCGGGVGEQREVCGVCGHCSTTTTTINETTNNSSKVVSSMKKKGYVCRDSEILTNFLYLGCYNDFYNSLFSGPPKRQGLTHYLCTVPVTENEKKSIQSFTFHYLDSEKLQFDDAIQFLDQCEKKKVHVLVYCMTGNSRSAAIVIAYLMKLKGWRLGQSYLWVKERRPSVNLSPDVNQQLQDYEQRIVSSDNYNADLVVGLNKLTTNTLTTKPPRSVDIQTSSEIFVMKPLSFTEDDLAEILQKMPEDERRRRCKPPVERTRQPSEERYIKVYTKWITPK